jgi:2-dehydro-3-deoxyphosphogluconate aldolase/(4S)-4-hydroxy-2-oxoglutarate aldolase
MTPDSFLDALYRHRAVAILRGQHTGRAAAAMEAAVGAGFRVLEFTLSTPGAFDLIAEFSRRPDLIVGAGTVLDLAGLETAVGADRQIVSAARELDVAVLPGCFTPTELLQAHKAGATCEKLFPAPGDIAGFVRSVLGPLPFLRIIPTNGVHLGNAAEVLASGAVGVGFTTSLFDPSEVEARRFDSINERAHALITAIKHFTNTTRVRGS